ncbi:MAG: transposase [Reichenbachiella sp.]|uniref:transposase n=2 Tax=Reichenbachiella sp. TaxID=2184521 RepID=UPI003298C36B
MEPNQMYHLYNRGNNREPIFFEDKNYYYFLNKIKKHLLPHVDVLAYCLMPNHFHLQIHTKNNFDFEAYGNALKIMLSSYTRGINVQEGRTGSLFQQHTKKKVATNYGFVCFHYIHQNPIRAGLVRKMEDWPYSSFNSYFKELSDAICNHSLAYELLDLPANSSELYDISYRVINYNESGSTTDSFSS